MWILQLKAGPICESSQLLVQVNCRRCSHGKRAKQRKARVPVTTALLLLTQPNQPQLQEIR